MDRTITTRHLIAVPFIYGLFWGTVAFGAPSVLRVAGDCHEGGEITLTGRELGANPVPVFWDAVENRLEYRNISAGSPVPDVLWRNGFFESDTPVTLSRAATRAGSEMHYRSVSTSKLYWPRPLDDTRFNSLYVSWRYKPSVDPYGNGGSNKFIRIWDDRNGNGTRISWTSMHMTYGIRGEGKTSWGRFNGRVNEWNLMEIWVDKAAEVIRASINGRPVHSVTDFEGAAVSRGLSVYLIGWDPSETARYPNMINDFDDIYISTTQARIELTEKPTWSATDAREVQPATFWSPERIAFSLHRGSVGLDNAYVHVIDHAGRAIASAQLACASDVAPLPPSDLSVLH